MDMQMIARWARLADYHERRAEVWRGHAERLKQMTASRRSITAKLSTPHDVAMSERLERTLASDAKYCRVMAAEHHRLSLRYRRVIETPWPTDESGRTGHAEDCEQVLDGARIAGIYGAGDRWPALTDPGQGVLDPASRG
jgi:hypothetical protein